MIVEVISPDDMLYSGEAVSVTLPGKLGSFTILNHHAPIVSVLEAGKVLVETADGKEEYEIKGGFIEQHDNKVTICIE